MTKTDFFRLMIKIFGLYLLVSIIFSTLPSCFTMFIEYFRYESFGTDGIPFVIWCIICFFVPILLFILLIRKADTIIKFLKLDKGFDDDVINLKNFDKLQIFKMAAIIIGGIIFIENISPFLSDVLFYFKSKVGNDLFYKVEYSPRDSANTTISALNIIVGYFLMAKNEAIARFISKDKKNEET